MARAGQLDRIVTFFSPIGIVSDADGKPEDGWQEEFEVWAKVTPLRGGEAVMHARMEAKSPASLTVWLSSQSERIMTDWRVVIAGRAYDLKEYPRPSVDGAFLDMLVEARP